MRDVLISCACGRLDISTRLIIVSILSTELFKRIMINRFPIRIYSLSMS